MNVVNNDSPKNCVMSILRDAPITFLIPTSLDRRIALEVERLMKLTQAISNMKTAIRINITTNSYLELVFHSEVRFE